MWGAFDGAFGGVWWCVCCSSWFSSQFSSVCARGEATMVEVQQWTWKKHPRWK